jgi:DNA-binding beta-propeller fold protein YncE
MGHLPGEFFGPTGIAVSRSGLIYVADTGNARVQVFSGSGEFLAFAGALSGSRRLLSPQSIAIDEYDNIYIADTLSHRVLQFDPLGKFTGEIGGKVQMPDGSLGRLVEPRAVAVERSGLIYIADRGDLLPDGNPSFGRLQVLETQDYMQLVRIDRLMSGLGVLNRPSGIAIGPPAHMPRGAAPRGDVYLSDTMNHRVLRYVWEWL